MYRMIENLGAKTLVMELVNHSNTEIRMQALLSIQKMMVQNWSVKCEVNSMVKIELGYCLVFQLVLTLLVICLSTVLAGSTWESSWKAVPSSHRHCSICYVAIIKRCII